MTSAGVRVVGIGLACPVGLTARTAAAAVRAGVSRFVEREDVAGRDGPVRASVLAALGGEHSRTERALWFARRAVAEALAGSGSTTDPLPCFLALPERDEAPTISSADVIAGLAGIPADVGAPVRLAVTSPRGVAVGRAGAFEALAAGVEALERGQARRVLVAGMDSQAPRCGRWPIRTAYSAAPTSTVRSPARGRRACYSPAPTKSRAGRRWRS